MLYVTRILKLESSISKILAVGESGRKQSRLSAYEPRVKT